MNRTPPRSRLPRRRPLTASVLLAGSLVLTGCSFGGSVGPGGATATGTGGGTTCNLNGCTVVLQRGVDARASVLGIDVELVGVTGDQVSLRVGGQQVSVPLDANASTSIAGLNVSVQSANASQIVLQVTAGG